MRNPLSGVSRRLARVAIVCLGLISTMLCMPETGRAQVASLLSADNSSPRASFDSFIRNTDALVDLWLTRAPIAEQKHRLRALVESFDFSATPYASSTSEQIRRIFMAREIVARVPTPPPGTIPDLDEVHASGLTSWTVPGTDLRMRRIASGRDEGDFKFDAATIEELDEIYQRVRDIPRPDAAPDTFRTYIEQADLTSLNEALIASRLHVVRTASPRDTMQAFLSNMTQAHAIALAAETKLDARPPQISLEDARLQ